MKSHKNTKGEKNWEGENSHCRQVAFTSFTSLYLHTWTLFKNNHLPIVQFTVDYTGPPGTDMTQQIS